MNLLPATRYLSSALRLGIGKQVGSVKRSEEIGTSTSEVKNEKCFDKEPHAGTFSLDGAGLAVCPR